MIVGLIPTYKEGLLARDAIRSILPICDTILVFDGPISGAPDSGIDTDYRWTKKHQKIILKRGEWKSEVEKRNAMLEFTRRYPAPVWGLYLDADEVILWGEYIESYIEACDAQAPEGEVNAACPLLRVEIDGSVQTLKRIIRLDLLERHILSMSQWKFYGSDIAVTFPAIPSDRKPNQGEPHIFHRAFLRPAVRGGFRLYEEEIKDFQKLEKEMSDKLGLPQVSGALPKYQDVPDFLVMEEREREAKDNVPASSVLMEIQAAEEIARQTKKK